MLATLHLKSKILLLGIIVGTLLSGIFAYLTDTYPGNGFFLMTGVIWIIGGLFFLSTSLFLRIFEDKKFSIGFFYSGSLLLAFGIISFFLLNQY